MDNTHPTCRFVGGTLGGKTEKRMMFGFIVETIMEPVYQPNDKGDCPRSSITHRQVYRRTTKLDQDGMLGYRLEDVVDATK